MSSETDSTTGVVKKAQEYYNSDDADRFYYNIWGGEDIHIGLYDGSNTIFEASHETVKLMAEKIKDCVSKETRILDIGAGYGGSARVLAKQFGCPVTCLNLSEVQNKRNRQMNEEQGLADTIDVHDGNFEALPFEDNAYDIVWCQDSVLHSGDRFKVFQEVHRVLESGGVFIFTDIMQKEPADPERLKPVYDRIHLPSLGSLEAYDEYAQKLGWRKLEFEDLSPQLPKHYSSVHDELEKRRDKVKNVISDAYVDRMLQGLKHWVAAGQESLLKWGILQYQKS